MKGKILRWVDERGFGFIKSDELDGDVFVHISKFPQGYRRPQVGDHVEFHLANNQPKLSAASARLIGVEPQKTNSLSVVISAAVLGLLGAGLYVFLIEPK